jgi:hypothetical protein
MSNPANEMRQFLKIVEGQPSATIQEGLWDKIKAWAGDEGAKARVALEKGAKRMMKEFQRFSGPYEERMRSDEDVYYKILYSYISRSYSDDVLRDALKRTQDDSEDMSGFYEYLKRNGGLKSDSGSDTKDQSKQGQVDAQTDKSDKKTSDDPFDPDTKADGEDEAVAQAGKVNDDSEFQKKYLNRNESVDAPWNTITETVILTEGLGKRQLVKLFMNVILTANERGYDLPADVRKEIESSGSSPTGLRKVSGGIFGGGFGDEDSGNNSRNSGSNSGGGTHSGGGVGGRISAQILSDYRRLMGGDERSGQEEVETLFSAIRDGNKFNTMLSDHEMQKRLAAMGYAFLRYNKDKLN